MPKAKQLTVPVGIRPRTLACVAKILGDAKVDIIVFLTTTSNAEGAVRVVVDNVDRAKKAWDSVGLSYSESDVVCVELKDVPGRSGNLRKSLLQRKSASPLGTPQQRTALGMQVRCAQCPTWRKRLALDNAGRLLLDLLPVVWPIFGKEVRGGNICDS